MKVPLDTLYALPPPLLFLVVLGVVGLVAFMVLALLRLPRPAKAVGDLAKITTAGVTVAGAIFGLSITFLANSVWHIEDQARETVNAEARAIRVMSIYMESLPAETRKELDSLIADYGRAVAAEWDDMAAGERGGPAEQALRGVYAEVIKGLPDGGQSSLLQQRLLTSLDSISTARQQRLSIAENFVSASQWTLVTGLALVLLFLLAASHAAFPVAQRVSISALSVAISIMLFVILLHDRPFIGYAAQRPDPILRATGALD